MDLAVIYLIAMPYDEANIGEGGSTPVFSGGST